jgi:apolipoprotein N-acyltransferase
MNKRTSALAVLSGLLLAAGFPHIHLSLLSWVSLIPLLFSLRGQTVKNAFWLGGISGIVYFAGTVHWVTNSVHFYGNIPIIPASLITLLLCAYLALYPAAFAAAFVSVTDRRPQLFVIAAPVLWTAFELARSHVFTGFPWALLGYTQYRALPVIQISDITGVYGISFLIVLVNAAFAHYIIDRRRYGGIIIALLALVFVLGYGYLRLERSSNTAGGVTIAVVQGNIEQDKKWDPAYQAETIGVYRRLTLDALKLNPDLIIWPETSTPFYFSGNSRTERELTASLGAFVKANGVPLLFGSPTYEIKGPNRVELRNTAFMLSSVGDVAGRYNKFHLVPFGEYIPLKKILFFVEKMVQAVGDFVPGTEFTVMTLPATRAETTDARISTVICYEIIFPDLVRKFVDRGAGIITTITNDAWFGRTAAPYQHFSMAVFRAVENRVPVARAANTGISGFIDAAGRIRAASLIFTEAVLVQPVVPGNSRTFYTRFGDVFSYLCAAGSLALLLKSSRRS